MVMTSGCIHRHKLVDHRDPRVPIAFETDTAARLFYEKLESNRSFSTLNGTRTAITVPLFFEHEVTSVRGSHVDFNLAVQTCDTNQNGIITEQEARIFCNPKK